MIRAEMMVPSRTPASWRGPREQAGTCVPHPPALAAHPRGPDGAGGGWAAVTPEQEKKGHASAHLSPSRPLYESTQVFRVQGHKEIKEKSHGGLHTGWAGSTSGVILDHNKVRKSQTMPQVENRSQEQNPQTKQHSQAKA